jgi:predicted nucleic acid-binding Zn ribbon protein
MDGVAVMAKKDPSPELAECSSCGAKIPADATECPQCGEIFSEELLKEAEGDRKSGRRERIMFYLGIVLILMGGPGIALGSLLHDSLRIPVIGSAYDEFGWLNRMVAAIGLVILIIGVVFMILSARLAPKSIENEYDIGTPKRT